MLSEIVVNSFTMISVLGIVLSFVGSLCKDRWIVFVRSFQLVLIQPMLQISFPVINLVVHNTLYQVASYDLLSYFNIWEQPFFSFLKFGNFDVPFITQQMQLIAFNNRNAFMGLGSIAIYILIYFINVFLVVLLKIYIFITNGKLGGQALLKYFI